MRKLRLTPSSSRSWRMVSTSASDSSVSFRAAIVRKSSLFLLSRTRRSLRRASAMSIACREETVCVCRAASAPFLALSNRCLFLNIRLFFKERSHPLSVLSWVAVRFRELGKDGGVGHIEDVIDDGSVETNAFFVVDPRTRKRATVGVVRSAGKLPFLRTYADGIWTDNLLSLNQCPLRQ